MVWMTLIEKLYLSTLILISLQAGLTKSDENEDRLVNYVTTAVLPDGERELHMRLGKTIVREISVTQTETEERKGLLLRQVASGPHFLQMIYKTSNIGSERLDRKLVECEIINDWGAANQFRAQFLQELHRAGLRLEVPVSIKHPLSNSTTEHHFVTSSSSLVNEIDMEEEFEHQMDGDLIDLDQGMDDLNNVTVRIMQEDEVTGDMKKAFDLIKQRRQCRRHHKKQQQVAQSINDHSSPDDKSRRVRREAFRVGIMPGTLWCGDGSIAEKYQSMGAHVGTDRCCRVHDGCPFIIDAMTSNYGLFNYRMHTLSHCSCDESRMGSTTTDKRSRSKRELDNAFQLPGTQWCGRGFSATEITQLGGFTGADKCCRYHDIGCPFYIEGFQEKYGVFNWRMYTINHCTCDERFRSCLKQTNTGAANFVGKIFFNVVQTKCFLLKPEKDCAKRSWWGKCLKYEYKKQAHLRDPIPY